MKIEWILKPKFRWIRCLTRINFSFLKASHLSPFLTLVAITHLPPLTFSLPCLGSHGLPSPPCEGDRDRSWSYLDHVALFLHFLPFIFLFLLLLVDKSASPKPPPLPFSCPFFHFPYLSSDLVLCEWDSPDPLGGSILQRSPLLLSTWFVASSSWWYILQPCMFCGHWVWGLLLVRDFLDYPVLGVDLSNLFILKSSTQIAWHLLSWTIRFDFSDDCLDGIKAPNFLSFRTSPVVVALVIYGIVDKFCVFCCCR